jgi:hypothetical protein
VVVAYGDTIKPTIVIDLKEDELTLLPPGIYVSLQSETVSSYGNLVPVMTIWTPFPKGACQYGYTQYACIGEGDTARFRPDIKPLKAGFTLKIEHEDWEMFKAVGATSKDVYYQVWHVGKGWIGHFFVSKDRQTMWTDVYPGDTYTVEPDGSKHITPIGHTKLQVYRRVSAPFAP